MPPRHAANHYPPTISIMTAGQNAPDGDEVVYEWREGNHKCIERRSGPGEDVRTCTPSLILGFDLRAPFLKVEVEVIRNAYKGIPNENGFSARCKALFTPSHEKSKEEMIPKIPK